MLVTRSGLIGRNEPGPPRQHTAVGGHLRLPALPLAGAPLTCPIPCASVGCWSAHVQHAVASASSYVSTRGRSTPCPLPDPCASRYRGNSAFTFLYPTLSNL